MYLLLLSEDMHIKQYPEIILRKITRECQMKSQLKHKNALVQSRLETENETDICRIGKSDSECWLCGGRHFHKFCSTCANIFENWTKMHLTAEMIKLKRHQNHKLCM